MELRRKRFLAALGLFISWVVALAVLAVTSARSPREAQPAAAPLRGWGPMPGPLTPRRRHDPELMDGPGLPPAEVVQAYRVLRRVNRQLGNLRTLRDELRRWLDEERPGATATLLDVGSGSGDLAASLRREAETRGVALRAVAADLDPIALGLAARERLGAIRADALRLPFPDGSFDLVTAAKFAHHFHGEGLTRLLAEMVRVARRRVVVLDIRRHWVAYAGFVLWSRLLTRSRLVRHDGPLSVLRGFTREELLASAEPFGELAWEVRSRPGFQLVLVGRRRGPAGGGVASSPRGS
jgi:ubiquinone/menaquinone biosynthesis C-methylase UbiE